MQRMVNGILRQYGTQMTLQRGSESLQVRGFFQPVRSKSWQSVVDVATLLGEVSRGQYIYIGPVGTRVSEGDMLVVGEKSYFFRRVELYYYGDEPTYIWGLCVEKGVNDTWGSQS